MDDLERTFREGLRDAAAKKPPLGRIDLDEVTTRPIDGPRRRPARWLAVAAAVVLVAGIGVGVFALSGRGTGVPAVPAPVAPVTSSVATDAPSVATCKVTDVGHSLHPNRVSVRVFDDGSIGGLSKTTALYLRSLDFKVLEYGTTSPIRSTTIRGTAADSPEVKLVQKFFPGSVPEGDGRADHSVDVLTNTQFSEGNPEPELADAAVPVSGPVCLPQIIANVQVSLEVRIRNETNLDFSTAKVISLEDKTVDFGALPAGAVSKYRVVERAYPNAWFVVETDATPSAGIQPQNADYKTPEDADLLGPGRYTYVIDRDGAGRLSLRLEVDR